MNIHEAMMARTKEKPFITRESWEKFVVFMEMDKGIYIQPTDTPEGCLFYGPAKKGPRRGWQPTATDLIATDWKTTTGG